MDSEYSAQITEDAQTELALSSDANIAGLSGIAELPLEEQAVELEELHSSLRAELDEAGTN